MREILFYKEFWYYVFSAGFFIASMTSFVVIKNKTGMILDTIHNTEHKIHKMQKHNQTLQKRYTQLTSSENIALLSQKYLTMNAPIVKKDIISLPQLKKIIHGDSASAG